MTTETTPLTPAAVAAMTPQERAAQIIERMDEWAAKDIPSEEWKDWVREEIERQIVETVEDDAKFLDQVARECHAEGDVRYAQFVEGLAEQIRGFKK